MRMMKNGCYTMLGIIKNIVSIYKVYTCSYEHVRQALSTIKIIYLKYIKKVTLE